MADRRTDLAAEAWELWRESAAELTEPEGVRARDRMREGCPVTEVEVLDERGEQELCKPIGRYVTLELGPLLRREEAALRETESFLSRVYHGSLSMMVSTLSQKQPLSQKEIDELYALLKEAEVKKDDKDD